MKKAKKLKKIIALVCLVAIVAFLALMPLLSEQKTEADGPTASILSGTVNRNSIDTALIGGGVLAEETPVTVTVPSAVKLTKFLVTNGDRVSQGDPLAVVDRVTVMTAIEQVQQTLDHLLEEIADASEEKTETSVKALAGGTVKILYAQTGDSVQSVMLEHGALAVLSLDGRMAVDLEIQDGPEAGAEVNVQLADGKTVTGRVQSNLMGEMTVTLADQDYAVDQQVQISTADGTVLGSGGLYIYNPWNVVAYTGTIGTVKVSEGTKTKAGQTLMTLEDTGFTATYQKLLSQRNDYEELMLELFCMYQTKHVAAPCDGVVSGVDPDSVQLLRNGTSAGITWLANAPNGDDESLYVNYLGKVSGSLENGWHLLVDPQGVQVADYLELAAMTPSQETLMTKAVYDWAVNVPIYGLQDGVWVQLETTEIALDDFLLFATDETGKLVWIVRIGQPETAPVEPFEPTIPSEPTTPTEPGESTDGNFPGGSFPSGNMGGSFPSGNMGSFPQGGFTEPEPEFELYSLEVSQIGAVTPQNTMTLDITVDERDVASLENGMEAEVMVNALGGEKITATITDIGNTGTNNGGSSKYTVQLTMDRTENMLSGMNATASVVLRTTQDVLTIPVAALVDKGNQTVVYTGFDQENETLTKPVTVTVGTSDGEIVEILEGLEEGSVYYYAYYDTLVISDTPVSGGGGMGFRP